MEKSDLEYKRDITLKSNPELNKYIQELNDDVKLTKTNLREKSLLISSIRCKWLAYYFKEQENLKRIKATKESILKSKIKDNSNKTSILQLKSEDKLSLNDENIKKLNKLMDITKDNINYLEHAMNILNDFLWDIKNAIEIFKLERM